MREITQLIRIMETIRKKVHSDLPVQQAHILLTVADHPGITLPEISRQLDMNQGTVSRNVKVLGIYAEPSKDEKGKMVVKGHDLVYTQPDLYNRKSLAVFLTKKGEEVVEALASAVKLPNNKNHTANAH